jgi:Endoplasmic reticulum-based factor for assembly of V-ATPase
MESLRRRLEQKEYDTMVANVKTVPKSSIFTDEDFSSADAKMLKNQLSAIINILLSMVSVFVAIFIWKRNSPDYLVWTLGTTNNE